MLWLERSPHETPVLDADLVAVARPCPARGVAAGGRMGLPTVTTVTLHLGDCLDVLPTLAADVAIIADPPYGVRARTAYKQNGRSNLAECNDFAPVYGDDKPFDPSPFLRFEKVILFGANHYCSRLPDASCWLTWDKREGITSNDNADCEMAWTNLGGPSRLFRHMWSGMIKASEKDQQRVHPTQKPVALMRWCIEQAKLVPGTLIVDPFMGAGATGIAAVQLGYPFLGCEIVPAYFDIAQRRIVDAQAQLALPLFGVTP